MCNCEKSDIENVSGYVLRDGGEDYRRFHSTFKNYSFCYKLGLIAWYYPSYIWYTWFAPAVDKYTYKALRNYLGKKV